MNINTDVIDVLYYAFFNGVLVGGKTQPNETLVCYSTDLGQTWIETSIKFERMVYTGANYILFISRTPRQPGEAGSSFLYRMDSDGSIRYVNNSLGFVRCGVKLNGSKMVFANYFLAPSDDFDVGLFQCDYDEINNRLYNLIRLQEPHSSKTREWDLIGVTKTTSEPCAFFMMTTYGDSGAVLAVKIPENNANVTVYEHHTYFSPSEWTDGYFDEVPHSLYEIDGKIYFYNRYYVYRLYTHYAFSNEDIIAVAGLKGKRNDDYWIRQIFYDPGSPIKLGCISESRYDDSLYFYRVQSLTPMKYLYFTSQKICESPSEVKEVEIRKEKFLISTYKRSGNSIIATLPPILVISPFGDNEGYTPSEHPDTPNVFLPFIYDFDWQEEIYGLLTDATEETSISIKTNSGIKKIRVWAFGFIQRKSLIVEEGGFSKEVFVTQNKFNKNQSLCIQRENGKFYIYLN